MSNARGGILQPDEEPRAPEQPVAPVVARDIVASDVLAVADAKAGDVIPLSIVEEYYKRPGGTLISRLFGTDPFDVWVGRFYVGVFGVISILAATIGAAFYFYQFLVNERTINILQARIDPPPIAAGLALVGPGQQGFTWQVIVFAATIAFITWGLREIDISLKLRMGIEIPLVFFSVVSSWLTLQFLRPFAMGAWGHGFPLGITHHLDWVSNVGYQYFNFFYNPFHALAIAAFFGSTMLLAMHGSAILSAINRPQVTVRNIDAFWRGIVGYSIGELGIHKLSVYAAVSAVLLANACIFLSGTLVQSWNGFWGFWDRLPWWSFAGLGAMAVVPRPTPGGRTYKPEEVDLEAVEAGGRGVEGNLGRPFYIGWMDRNFGSGTFGPIYLGIWGLISVGAGAITGLILITEYLRQVGYNPILLVREIAVVSVNPPPVENGLNLSANWYNGGAWIWATLFLHIAVLAWLTRVWSRARSTAVGTNLAKAFSAAVFLYLVIYLIRPVLLGSWNEAPGHGLKSHLDWVNNVNLRYGNFYYNPFHMISIFFLFGSTMLLGMHGATIAATARYGSDLELKEAEIEGPGTHRGQLFWRWTMGFNANAASIHDWLWWFAVLCVISGGIGLLLSGPVINDWYGWAIQARIAAPPAP